MADIAETDLAYVVNMRERVGKKYLVQAQIVFGDGVLTYPTGGIPITNSKLGFRRGVESLTILESDANTSLYEWDRQNNKIRIFTEARVEASGGVTTPAATTLEVFAVGW